MRGNVQACAIDMAVARIDDMTLPYARVAGWVCWLEQREIALALAHIIVRHGRAAIKLDPDDAPAQRPGRCWQASHHWAGGDLYHGAAMFGQPITHRRHRALSRRRCHGKP